MPTLHDVLAHVEGHRNAFLDRLFDYLRRPSTSAQGVGIAESRSTLPACLIGSGWKRKSCRPPDRRLS
jgi:hypothetical protein